MVNSLPKQPESINHNQFTNFSEGVKHYMNEKNMTQAELSRASLMSKTIISRICRDSNDKGSYYTPALDCFMAVSIGLKLTPVEAKELFIATLPELALFDGFLEQRLNIDQVNEILYDKGLCVLGSTEE